MSGQALFPPPEDFRARARLKSEAEYMSLYEESVRDPEGFWRRMAGEVSWSKEFRKVMDCDFNSAKVAWYLGGKLNVSYNCLDRHIENGRAEKTALIWAAETGETRKFTYRELHGLVCGFAGLLKKLGVGKGDRVAFYLPMVPELAIGMLAVARIGAVHSVVFGGFSAASLRDRINDSGAKVLVTSDGSYRGGKTIPLKASADLAMKEAPSIEKCIVVKRTGEKVDMEPGRDIYLREELQKSDIEPCIDAVDVDAEDPLFILYTSGSTGKPKGLIHAAGGYIVYATSTFKYIFDWREEDVFWCTADIGWITGHSYIVYGPLSAGATSVMFEGVPTYPKPDRYWEVVEKYGVSVIYTAPTVIRSLMREGDEWTETRDLSSLRLLGTVGEPINPEAWLWYYEKVGKGRCPIVDTWWQTETGGVLISSLPGAVALKPGYAGRPFFGISPAVMAPEGREAKLEEDGSLVIKSAWPGLAKTIYGDPKRFYDTYFSQFKGYYFTGDGARVDKDGDYRILGRIDDVINVSGHRLGTAEIESALVAHHGVAEAAVVGFPHEMKGQGIYCFVILKSGVPEGKELEAALIERVRLDIGPIAKPDVIQFVDGLPKTRSGKIMRRILRKIVEGKEAEIGDTSTLSDPSVVGKLIEGKKAVAGKD